ncbi:MAG: hypothetical protein ISR65_18740 [Bacteriovoracaceae bacterium]|nr:hypothetical protein [Bacteriovoracaceae bacterium]
MCRHTYGTRRINNDINIWQFISAFEFGQAADQFSDLFEHSRYSLSIGLRAFIKELPIRLEAAIGNEGETIFLTFGKSF